MALLSKLAKTAYKMTPKRKAALKKAALASAKKRSKGGTKKVAKKLVGKNTSKVIAKAAPKKTGAKKAASKIASIKAAKRPATTPTSLKGLMKKKPKVSTTLSTKDRIKKAKLRARADKYAGKAERVERNIHGSFLKDRSKLNKFRSVKLGHYSRKSRRLGNSAKRIR
jgi:hypothetical protein